MTETMRDNCGNFNDKRPEVDVDVSAGVKDMLARAHPDIRKALVELRKYDSKVVAAFKDRPDLAAKFVSDPASVLAEIGIPIDAPLKNRLKTASLQSFLQPRSFCLPDGKVLNARVRVSIVGTTSDRQEVARK